MGAVVDFADFWPISESEVGARNGQERVECGPERPIQAAGEVRRRSQEPASVRGNRRDQTRKNPNRERLGFQYWWWNTEPNPRPLSEPDSNALTLRAWIRRFGHSQPAHNCATCWLRSRSAAEPFGSPDEPPPLDNSSQISHLSLLD